MCDPKLILEGSRGLSLGPWPNQSIAKTSWPAAARTGITYHRLISFWYFEDERLDRINVDQRTQRAAYISPHIASARISVQKQHSLPASWQTHRKNLVNYIHHGSAYLKSFDLRIPICRLNHFCLWYSDKLILCESEGAR